MGTSDDKHESAVKTILSLGEEKMSEAVGQLLRNEAFARLVGKAVTGGLSAKRNVDKGVATVLAFANVPTLGDVENVRERLGEAEEALATIAKRLQGIDEKLAQGRGRGGASKSR